MVDKELKRLKIKENIFDETLMEVLNDKELPDILEFFRINQYEMKTSKDDIYNDIMNFSEIKLDEIEKTLIEKD